MIKTGILLINLGTPDSGSPADVRRYLNEFLMDPRVIDVPAMWRWWLLNLMVLPTRPKKTAAAYQKIWLKEGPPLLVYSQQFADQLATKLGDEYQVALGMRYGHPSIRSAVQQLEPCQRLIILPLFPQYASASTGSALEEALRVIKGLWNVPAMTVMNAFYHHPGFIRAYVEQIQHAVAKQACDYYLFSYHGLPERQLMKSDCANVQSCRAQHCPAIHEKNYFCYRAQCFATTQLLVEQLQLTENNFSTAFQSRLGRTPWIQPYTDLVLPQLIQQGVKRLAIVCPSFVMDCLETLEEIGIRAREQWQQLGGESLTLVPCLNASATWVNAVADWVKG